MPKNLRSLSLPVLTDAVEFNIQELSTLWGHALGADFHHEPEATWFVSGVPFWSHNWVTKTQITADTPQDKIDAIMKRLKEYQLPMFWIVDSASSSAFIDHIGTYGWQGGPTTVWARDLHTLDEKQINPAGVTVERVDNIESLKQWIHAFVFGYNGIPAHLYDHAVELLLQHGFVSPPGVHYYLGRLNGEPVTSTLLFLGGGVAGIYCTATLPHARRHGVGRSVVLASLLDARAMGYHIAALQASDMGLPVYRSLGFEEYETINFYILPGTPKE
jgi:GNAT superfamily N-acetyltransferase